VSRFVEDAVVEVVGHGVEVRIRQRTCARLLTGTLNVMLNDVKATDPSVFAGTIVAVLVVAILASYLPARSAGRVDPTIVLRDS
jgi:hypothetical protein